MSFVFSKIHFVCVYEYISRQLRRISPKFTKREYIVLFQYSHVITVFAYDAFCRFLCVQ